MSRYFLSFHAKNDLDEIRIYLRAIPPQPAKRIGVRLQQAFNEIAASPQHGIAQSALTLLAGVEVRSRLCSPYRIFYISGRTVPEILGVIHTARDIATIMAGRFQ